MVLGAEMALAQSVLVGRDREITLLKAAVQACEAGRGDFILISGEAGVGKTALLGAALTGTNLLAVHVAATQPSQERPLQVITVALRAYLRHIPDALDACGHVSDALDVFLRESAGTSVATDPESLLEGIKCAFSEISRRQPAALILDDLQWADGTTLELLPELAASLADERFLILAAYGDDQLARRHPLRRIRVQLRKAGRLHEIGLKPLSAGQTSALTGRIWGKASTRELAILVYARTQGVPFFIEELAATLQAMARLKIGDQEIDLAGDGELPIPESVRDSVRLRAEGLSPDASRSLEFAAVAGEGFELELLADLGAAEGIVELVDGGFLIETRSGTVAFRRTLIRDAVYADIDWTRRRTLHRALAELMERYSGADPALLAEHWLGAGEHERARLNLLAAGESSAAAQAYRAAALALAKCLQLWPADVDTDGRLATIERLGHCAELAGDLVGAVRAFEDLSRRYRATGAFRFDIERRLASVYELQGAWGLALLTRGRAADAFASNRQPGEAAAERLAMAAHFQSSGRLSAALQLLTAAAPEVEEAGQPALRARLLTLEGQVRAKLGQGEAGVALAREGLALALGQNLIAPASDAYYRLASALEHSASYPSAKDAYQTAFEYCRQQDVAGLAEVCFACLAPVMLRTGEWPEAERVCKQVLADPESPVVARMVAGTELGLLLAIRGEPKRARQLLEETLKFAQDNEIFGLEIDATYGLARVDELEDRRETAVDRMRSLAERCNTLEERHYSVSAIRWATTLFGRSKQRSSAAYCAERLAAIAASGTDSEALAALAHALGEVALVDGDVEAAAEQFSLALDHLAELAVPYERAETQVRCGVALAAAGQTEAAIEKLVAAYGTARKLRARPLSASAAQVLAALGQRADRRAGRFGGHSLTRRELQVMRLVGAGRSNREIAHELFLSPRTIEMHVANSLDKLGCRSRTEAVGMAVSLGLLSGLENHSIPTPRIQ